MAKLPYTQLGGIIRASLLCSIPLGMLLPTLVPIGTLLLATHRSIHLQVAFGYLVSALIVLLCFVYW